MSDLRTAAQAFLSALKTDRHDWEDWPDDSKKAIADLRAALVQEPAVQEPVAILHSDGYWTRKDTEAGRKFSEQMHKLSRVDAYTAPQPTVQPAKRLSDEERKAIAWEQWLSVVNDPAVHTGRTMTEIHRLAVEAVAESIEAAVLGRGEQSWGV